MSGGSVFEGYTGDISQILDSRYGGGGVGAVAETVQAASFNAVLGEFYPIDATASVTMMLPASGLYPGAWVSVQVVAGPSTNSLLTHPVTVNGNGHVFKAAGGSSTAVLQQVSQGMLFTYTGSVWRIQDSVSLTQEILRTAGSTGALPPSGGDDTTAIQALMTAAAAAGGGIVSLAAGAFSVTGLVIDTLVSLVGAGDGATTLTLANTSNQHVIRTKGFENFVPGRLSAALAHGVAVTSIPCTPLTHAIVNGDTLKFGTEYTTQTATASGPAAIGATSIPVTSFTPSGTDDFPVGLGIKLNANFTTAPYGFSIKGLTIDGNSANNTTGMGLAIYGYRYSVDDVLIYKTPEVGFFSSGTTGSTTAYPNGQIETRIGRVYVAQGSTVGFHYEGPHDGYCDWIVVRSCTGIGVEMALLDGNYMHSYGNLQGVSILAGGYMHWNHVQTENNVHENLITAFTNPTSTNSILRLTSYAAWTSGTATTANFAVLLNNTISIGDLNNRTTNGESGIYMQGKGSVVSGGYNVGVALSGTTGLSISADEIDVSLFIDSWYVGWQRFGKNGTFNIRGTACTHYGYTDVDSTNSGTSIDFAYLATASETPWNAVPAAAGNAYRLISTGSVVLNYERTAEGLDSRTMLKLAAREVSSGESSIPMELASGAIALTSQEIRFSFWTASKTETIANIRGVTSTVAAGATPTGVVFGLWSVDASDNVTPVASCASDTTLMAATNTAYTRALASPSTYAKVAGSRYATGYWVVTGAALPTVPGANFNGPGSEPLLHPVQSARIASQATYPTAQVLFASLLTSGQRAYMVVTP